MGEVMKVCVAEFPVDSGILVVGSAEPSDGPQPTLEQLPVATGAQVFLSCRQQIAPVRVEVWRGGGLSEIRTLLTAEIALPAGRLTVGESFLPPCLSWPVCSPGETVEIGITADDRANASHVIITVNPVEPQVSVLTDRDVAVRSLADMEDLSAALAEHSFPMDRLAASLRIIRDRARDGVSAARLRYAVQSVIEWMRWLRAGIPAGDLAGIEEIIMNAVSADLAIENAAGVVFSALSDTVGVPLAELLVARR
jgi:hypothetical protein